LVKIGDKFFEQGITVEIVEVIEYTRFSGRKMLLIGYRIKDGDYRSPVAHFWMDAFEDITEKIKEIVDYYLNIRKVLR